MIKLISFDLDNVFLLLDSNKFVSNFAKRYSLKENAVCDVLFVRYNENSRFTKLRTGKLEPKLWWDYIRRNLGLEGKMTKNDYLEEFAKVRKVNKKLASLISEIRKRGVKTAICSNNYKDNIDYLTKKFNLIKYFDLSVFSYRVGVLKPDPKIYKELIKKAGVNYSEILFVDDSEKNIKAAQELGMQTYLFKNTKDIKTKLQELGVI